MFLKRKKRKINKHFYKQDKTLTKVKRILLNLQDKLQKGHILLMMQPHYESLRGSMATPVMQLLKINVSTLHTPKMLMMTAKKKKLNRILILVYLAISMGTSMVMARIVSILLTHIIGKNLKQKVITLILLLNKMARTRTHISRSMQRRTICFLVNLHIEVVMKVVLV